MAGSYAISSRRVVALWNLGFGYAATIINVGAGIVLVPLYLRHFGADTYGAWLATGNVVGLLTLSELGLNLVFMRVVSLAVARGDQSDVARQIGGGLLLAFGSGIVLIASSVILADRILSAIRAPQSTLLDLRTALILSAVGAALQITSSSCGAIMQAWQDPVPGGVANLASALVGVVITVAALMAGLGVVALGAGICARGVVGVCALGASVARAWIKRGIPPAEGSWLAAGGLLRSVLPAFAGRIGGNISANSESALSSGFFGPGAAATYGLTGRLYSLIAMMLGPLGSSAYAGLAGLSETDKPKAAKVVADLLSASIVVGGALTGILVGMNQLFVGMWVGDSHFGGQLLSAMIGVAAMTTAIGGLCGFVVNAFGGYAVVTWASAADAVVRIGFVVLLFPRLGLAAMPLGAMLSAAIVGGPLYGMYLRTKLGSRGRVIMRSVSAAAFRAVAAVAAGAASALMLDGSTSVLSRVPVIAALFASVGIVSLSGAAMAPFRSAAVQRIRNRRGAGANNRP